MVRYKKYGSRIFLAPDLGGGTGNPGANQAGAVATDGSEDVFKDLDLDDLDAGARAIVEKAKGQLASLQKEKGEATLRAQTEEAQRKQFQSNYDKLQAQIQKGQQQQELDPRAKQLASMEQILVKRGFTADTAKGQAELMLELMTDFGTQLKGEIGHDLAPFAGQVVVREAEFAFNSVQHTDTTGAFQIPAVQQEVWNQCQAMAQNGQQVTPEIVENLAGMAYFKHIKTNSQFVSQPQQQQSTLPNFGRPPSFGGAPSRPQQVDPNAPRHALNEATDAALQVVLGNWAGQGHKAPGFKGGKK